MKRVQNTSGQFTPITAMVTFSVVMFMIAMVNVYTVARAKLQVQNLADAAALNLASQQAQIYNIVTDRNEWMNHMLAGIASPSDPNAPQDIKDCSIFSAEHPTAIPGISCVENPFNPNIQSGDRRVFSRHIFFSRDGAINYASVIQSVNAAQALFIKAYNSFLGVSGGPTQSSAISVGPTNFLGLLQNDIPEFKNPKIHITTWNSRNEPTSEEAVEWAQANANKQADTSRMEKLKFVVDHDIETVYGLKDPGPDSNSPFRKDTLGGTLYGDIGYLPADNSPYGQRGPLFGHPCDPDIDPSGSTAGDNGKGICAVGWLRPDDKMPRMQVSKGGEKVGVGVLVTKEIKLPIVGTRTIVAKAKAYVVEGSGEIGPASVGSNAVARFKPTFWVKLAN